jgi:hypothetical protein
MKAGENSDRRGQAAGGVEGKQERSLAMAKANGSEEA